MITKYLICTMVIITLVCSLSFCEEPSDIQRSPTIIQKEMPPPDKPETEADPEGFSGMF